MSGIVMILIISGCDDRVPETEETITCKVSFCNPNNETFQKIEISWTPHGYYCVCLGQDGLVHKYLYEMVLH